MPASFRILPDFSLVLTRYNGDLRLDEAEACLSAFLKDAAYRPGMAHLVDMSGITGFDKDLTRMMQLQARKAEAFLTADNPTVIVYYAPTSTSQRLARRILRSWDGLNVAVLRVAAEEMQVRDILGLRPTELAELIAPDS
jgi:hypothetical protein